MLRIVLGLVIIFATPVAASAQGQEAAPQVTLETELPPEMQVTVDGKPFAIPAPSGYEDVSAKSEKIRAFGQRIAPQGAKLLGYFVGRHLVSKITQNFVPTTASLDFFTVYAISGYEGTDMGLEEAGAYFEKEKADFLKRREAVADKADAFLEASEEKLTKKAIFDLGQTMPASLPLEIYLDKPDGFATITLHRQQRKRGMETFNYVLVNTDVYTVAGGKPLRFENYRVLNENADLGAAKTDALNWAVTVVNRNGALLEPAQSDIPSSGSIVGKFVFFLLAIIGSVAVLSYSRRGKAAEAPPADDMPEPEEAPHQDAPDENEDGGPKPPS